MRSLVDQHLRTAFLAHIQDVGLQDVDLVEEDVEGRNVDRPPVGVGVVGENSEEVAYYVLVEAVRSG